VWRTEDEPWQTVHDAIVGIGAQDYEVIWTACTSYNGAHCEVTRSFFLFDLSSIPASAEIISAIFTIGGHLNPWEATSTVCIQQGTQADILTVNDYTAFAGAAFAAVTWKVSGPGGTNLNEFILNAAGLAYIQSVFGGTAKICAREYGSDYENADPGFGVGWTNDACFSEYADAALRPILTVIYKC